jgi:hypothetical protein
VVVVFDVPAEGTLFAALALTWTKRARARMAMLASNAITVAVFAALFLKFKLKKSDRSERV